MKRLLSYLLSSVILTEIILTLLILYLYTRHHLLGIVAIVVFVLNVERITRWLESLKNEPPKKTQ